MNMFTISLEDSYLGIQKEIRQNISHREGIQIYRDYPLNSAGFEAHNIEPTMLLVDHV